MSAIELPVSIQEQLLLSQETGMDYQTGDITLSDGQIVRDCIFNAGYVTKVQGNGELSFETIDIVAVILTHRKWKW